MAGAPARRTTWLAIACLASMLACILGLGAFGVYQQADGLAEVVVRSEVESLELRATRAAGQLEGILEDAPSSMDTDASFRHWFDQSWSGRVQIGPRVQCAAVIRNGRVVAHTNRELVGLPVEEVWHPRKPPAARGESVAVATGTWSDGEPVYNVRAAVVHSGDEIASYHEGLNISWLANRIQQRREAMVWRWGLILALVAVTVLLGSCSVYYLASRTALMRGRLALARSRQAAELTQISAGLTHEMRNSLHALRLNLRILALEITSEQPRLDEAEVDEVIRESNATITQVDSLLQEFLAFARPTRPESKLLSLGEETARVVHQLGNGASPQGICIEVHAERPSPKVRIDRSRYEQILTRLLVNAKEAVGEGGRIDVEVKRSGRRGVVAVADSGPGIATEEEGQIFQPFFSTKARGPGLGLALVRRFVEEADGRVCYSREESCFRIEIPIASKAS